MMIRLTCAASLLILAGISGCANSATQSDAARATVPKNLSIVFGQSGGFTGLWNGYTILADGSVWNGYTILADGSVQAWSGPVQNDNPETIGTLRLGQMQALWRQIQEADYFNQDKRETGNMTAFMEITADSIVHRTSWIPHVEGIEEPTIPLEILYVTVSALAKEAGDG